MSNTIPLFGGELFSWIFNTQFPLKSPFGPVSGRWTKPGFLVSSITFQAHWEKRYFEDLWQILMLIKESIVNDSILCFSVVLKITLDTFIFIKHPKGTTGDET